VQKYEKKRKHLAFEGKKRYFSSFKYMKMTRFFLLACLLTSLQLMAQPSNYEWRTPSKNSSESMPCGGGDVGMNVWVEDGDVLFYLSRSGCFDENNTLLKLGRFRVHLTNPLHMQSFRQQLVLHDGFVRITDGQRWVEIWADVNKPVVHVDVSIEKEKTGVEVTYESWRTEDRPMTKREGFQSSWKFGMPKGIVTRRDAISNDEQSVTFVHRNAEETIFDATVRQQKLEGVKAQLYNPLKDLTFGGRLMAKDFVFVGKNRGRYQHADYEGWQFRSKREARRHHIQIAMATVQGTMQDWQHALQQTEAAVDTKRDQKLAREWWHQFWQRSFIEQPARPNGTLGSTSTAPKANSLQPIANYTLFRYMLGCNARGKWPTKFNGGLFTFDPCFVNKAEEYQLSADFRNWGGGVHTAQNQRLVYWPALKNGAFDMLHAQLDFYLRILRNAELRSEVYWGHGGACYTEQIENYGLPNYAEYGTKRPESFDPGMERNAWLEYEWDTALEFCMMALEAHEYCDMAIQKYVPMIVSVLSFFDQHYKYLAQQRGAKTLDGNGHLVIYPGSGGETFKMAYNPSSTVAGLRAVTEALMHYAESENDTALYNRHAALLARLPEIPIRDGLIQPAEVWARVQNVESTMLYPVYPWRQYGVGRDSLHVARNTYWQDPYAQQFRSHVGWKQDNIWAACLGLTEEARRLTLLKLADGPYRFPAFWGPGFDWSPDHNWGGSGMIGMQEMLLQEVGNRLYLFPAWPKEWDVHFRLHAKGGTTVEATLQDGQVTALKVSPESRRHDIVLP